MRLHRPSPLSRELEEATLLARRGAFASALQAFGFPPAESVPWGVAGVTACPTFYQPDEAGFTAAIVPVFDAAEVVDLVACCFATRAMRTRRGVAVVLGEEWILDASLGNTPLDLYDDALTWLLGGCRGVVVLDWIAAPALLRDVASIACESPATARRLTAAFERPSPYPTIHVHQGERA